MTRLLLSTAALALIASPALADAKKPHPMPAKHKVVKAKTTKTTETKIKAQ